MLCIRFFNPRVVRSVNAPNTAPLRGIYDVHPIPGKERRGHGGGTLRRRTPYGQSGSLRGLKLVPIKWRCLVPPTSTPHGHNAHR